MQIQPGPTGLYDPRFEHDSCGVSFVAHMRGVRSNDLVMTGLRALTNLAHRGATGAEPDTGDGAGILLQMPDKFLRAVVGFALPAEGAYAAGDRLPPDRDDGAREGARRDRGHRRRGGARRARLARPADPARLPRRHRPRRDADDEAVLRRRRRRCIGHRPRPQDVRRPQARRARVGRGPDDVLLVAVGPHDRLQGDADDAAARPVLPRSRRSPRRERAAAGALPLLDEHVPVVAARPPVPLHRPQRRDQHRPGQPELDACPRGDGVEPAPAEPRQGVPDLHPGRVRHGPLRRGAGVAAPGRAPDPARDPDDDPRGVGEQRRDGRRQAGVLPVPRQHDGALGRPGQRDVHRRHGDRRRARPQRAAARAATGSPTTTWS